MTIRFSADSKPSQSVCDEMAASGPHNPFFTSSYLEARRALGWEPWVLSLRRDNRLLTACPAFMKTGRLTRWFEITSLPSLSDPDVFWTRLVEWCVGIKVTHLEVNSFASEQAVIPPLPGESGRRRRAEYVLDLDAPNLWGRLSSNHARNLKRAHNMRLEVRRRIDAPSCDIHAALIAASMERRKLRGEQVPAGEVSRGDLFAALTRHGAGELFQAVADGKVVSSILVLMAERAGYYHSAGTDLQGMACGASHFLIQEIVRALQAASKRRFNLGGVDLRGSGLEQFKAGFGGRPVALESAECRLAGAFKAWLGAGVRFLREVAVGAHGR
jgi:hypothetical protein